MNQQNSDVNFYKGISAILFLAVIVLAGAFYIVVRSMSTNYAAKVSNTTQAADSTGTGVVVTEAVTIPVMDAPKPKTNCEDVTSIDHNWDNDVFCKRSDGTTFYTNYAGGRAADPNFLRKYRR